MTDIGLVESEKNRSWFLEILKFIRGLVDEPTKPKVRRYENPMKITKRFFYILLIGFAINLHLASKVDNEHLGQSQGSKNLALDRKCSGFSCLHNNS